MNDQIQMTLIANAGVLIEYKGNKLLADGLQDGVARLFPTSPIPEETLIEMTSGSGSLRDIDTLLFTHEHRDHFSVPLLQRYLENNRVKTLILPAGVDPDTVWPTRSAALNGCAVYCAEDKKIRAFHINEGISVYAIPTTHMGERFQTVRHSCFLIALDGIVLLFLGDADPLSPGLQNVGLAPSVDVVFTNPIFLHSSAGKRFIRELQPRAVAVYHIPFEKDGPQYRHAVLREIQNLTPEEFPIIPFCTASQKIVYKAGCFHADAC